MTDIGGDLQGRRTWLIAAREAHSLDRDQATILIDKRKPGLPGPRRERAIHEREARQGLSQPDMAILVEHIAGISCSQNEISRIETGGRQRLNLKYVEAIAKILRISRDEIMYGGPQPRVVKVLGEMQGSEMIRAYPEAERVRLAGFTLDEDTIGYRIEVDAHGLGERGDLLLCNERSVDFEECYGRWCVVEIDGQRYVGKVEKGAREGRTITVRPSSVSNPLHIDVQPSWISPVLGVSKAALAAQAA